MFVNEDSPAYQNQGSVPDILPNLDCIDFDDRSDVSSLGELSVGEHMYKKEMERLQSLKNGVGSTCSFGSRLSQRQGASLGPQEIRIESGLVRINNSTPAKMDHHQFPPRRVIENHHNASSEEMRRMGRPDLMRQSHENCHNANFEGMNRPDQRRQIGPIAPVGNVSRSVTSHQEFNPATSRRVSCNMNVSREHRNVSHDNLRMSNRKNSIPPRTLGVNPKRESIAQKKGINQPLNIYSPISYSQLPNFAAVLKPDQTKSSHDIIAARKSALKKLISPGKISLKKKISKVHTNDEEVVIIDMTKDKAINQARRNKWVKSCHTLSEVLECQKSSNRPNPNEIANTLYHYGTALTRIGCLIEAVTVLKEGIQTLFPRRFNERNMDLASLFFQMGNVYAAMNDFDAALCYLDFAAQVETRICGNSSASTNLKKKNFEAKKCSRQKIL